MFKGGFDFCVLNTQWVSMLVLGSDSASRLLASGELGRDTSGSTATDLQATTAAT